ncbi:MAG: hypothetical protein Q7S86_04675 [bacterium]|nr:hypothetical protein [bacterium]
MNPVRDRFLTGTVHLSLSEDGTLKVLRVLPAVAPSRYGNAMFAILFT